MKNKLILSIVISILCKNLFGTIFYVPNDYTTIQNGIDAISIGDTLLVEPGVYYENINFNGKSIVLGSRYLLTNDTSYISSTIIDGNQNGSVVSFENFEPHSTIFIGFTVQNGLSASGGGIYINESSPTILNSTIKNNLSTGSPYWYDGGGGIYCSHSQSIFKQIEISNNIANASGGGLFIVSTSDVLIEDSKILGNISNDNISGGAIKNSDSKLDLINVLIANNRTETGDIGGIYTSGPSSILNLLFVTVTNNQYWGIYSIGGLVNIKNSIVFNNDNGIYDYSSNSFFDISYSLIFGGYIGIGNIDFNPLFIDDELNNYKLRNNSQCIGAGVVIDSINSDIEGNPRPNPEGSHPDIGAFENSLAEPDNALNTSFPVFNHLTSFEDDNARLDIFPNPNGGVLSLEVSKSEGQVEIEDIEIWDIEGRFIRKIPANYKGMKYETVLNLSSIQSGVYLIKINTKDKIGLRKFVIQK